MFNTSDDITFGFDELGRLRIGMPAQYRPLAAWLYTDVQGSLAGVDGFIEVLRGAEQEGTVVNGNGCAVTFAGDQVEVASLYGRWAPLSVPRELFWPVLTNLRGFLAGVADEPGLVRENYPDVTRMAVIQETRPGSAPEIVDHTYFPKDWSEDMVREAGTGAWQSDQALYDEETGAWSGFWRNLEIAGYYDTDSGNALVYFPVSAP